MIWLRRGLAIPLIILFVFLFTSSLIITQLDSTFGHASFYNKQMHKADMYNFIYDKALPAALDEIEAQNPPQNIPVHLSKVKGEVVTDAQVAIPPAWVETQFESATNTFLPYFLGSTDKFTYTLMGKDRAEAIAQVLNDKFLQGETFQSVYNDSMSYLADKLAENVDQLPYDAHFTKEEIEVAIKKAAPPEWVIAQIGPAIDSIMPYLTKESSNFTVRIPVKDRVDVAATVILDLFSRDETYQYLMDQMILPTIEESLGQIVNLPFNVSLTEDEINSAIKEVLPPSWIQGQFKMVIDSAAAYVKGESSTIAIAVDLTDRKADAVPVLTQLADQKLNALFNSLPTCSPQQFAQEIRNLPPNSIPSCRPAGISYDQFKSALNLSISNVVQQMVVNQIPDWWTYTDADLRRSMGTDNEKILDDARRWVRDDYTYTDADLKDEMTLDQQKTFEDARDWVANGYTVTEQKLRDKIAENDPQNLQRLDDARSAIHTVRSWMWAIALLPFVLLLAIGFLAGRGWKGRVLWAFITLFVTSLIIFVSLTVIQSHVFKPEIRDAFDLSNKSGLELVMLQKGQEVAVNVSDSFVGGIETKVMVSIIVSGLVLAGTIVWSIRESRKNKKAMTKPPDAP